MKVFCLLQRFVNLDDALLLPIYAANIPSAPFLLTQFLVYPSMYLAIDPSIYAFTANDLSIIPLVHLPICIQ